MYYRKDTWIQRRLFDRYKEEPWHFTFWTKPTAASAAKPLCQQGCPIHTNIPEVIRLLKDNHLDDAGRMLFENNP